MQQIINQIQSEQNKKDDTNAIYDQYVIKKRPPKARKFADQQSVHANRKQPAQQTEV